MPSDHMFRRWFSRHSFVELDLLPQVPSSFLWKLSRIHYRCILGSVHKVFAVWNQRFNGRHVVFCYLWALIALKIVQKSVTATTLDQYLLFDNYIEVGPRGISVDILSLTWKKKNCSTTQSYILAVFYSSSHFHCDITYACAYYQYCSSC